MPGFVTLTITGGPSGPDLVFASEHGKPVIVSTTVDDHVHAWMFDEMDLYSLQEFCDETIRRIEARRIN